MGNKTFDFSIKKGFFAPKRPNLAQNWHFWSIMCPVGGSVGGCSARAVSRKTPIYFIIHTKNASSRVGRKIHFMMFEISVSDAP